MKKINKGQKKLNKYLKTKKYSLRQMGKILGVDHTCIYYIITGRNLPGVRLATKLNKLIKIKYTDWE